MLGKTGHVSESDIQSIVRVGVAGLVLVATASLVGAQTSNRVERDLKALERAVHTLRGNVMLGIDEVLRMNWRRDSDGDLEGGQWGHCKNAGGQRDVVYLTWAERRGALGGRSATARQTNVYRTECESFRFTNTPAYSGLRDFILENVTVYDGRVTVPTFTGPIEYRGRSIGMSWASDHYYRTYSEELGTKWVLFRQVGRRASWPASRADADRPSRYILSRAQATIQAAVTAACEQKFANRDGATSAILADTGLPRGDRRRLRPVVERVLSRVSVGLACDPDSSALWQEFEYAIGAGR